MMRGYISVLTRGLTGDK